MFYLFRLLYGQEKKKTTYEVGVRSKPCNLIPTFDKHKAVIVILVS